MNRFYKINIMIGALIWAFIGRPIYGMENEDTQEAAIVSSNSGSEGLSLEGLAARLVALQAQQETSDRKHKEELKAIESRYSQELAAIKKEHKEQYEAYTDTVASVVNQREPVFFQEIVANKLLLGVAVCSVVGFSTNYYYAYHETGSVVWAFLRASKDTLRDFVTFYYGAKIIEQTGILTSSFTPKTQGNSERKKER